MIIYPDKLDIKIVIFLFIVSACAAVLFFFEFGSLLWAFLILLICGFWAVRYWIAFGRTISVDSDGVQISFLWCRHRINWDDMHRIAFFDRRNTIGYKDVAITGIEFFSTSKNRPPKLSPSSYCLFLHPMSYVFLNFSESVSQPKGVHYPAQYQVKKDVIVTLLESNNVPIKGRG